MPTITVSPGFKDTTILEKKQTLPKGRLNFNNPSEKLLVKTSIQASRICIHANCVGLENATTLKGKEVTVIADNQVTVGTINPRQTVRIDSSNFYIEAPIVTIGPNVKLSDDFAGQIHCKELELITNTWESEEPTVSQAQADLADRRQPGTILTYIPPRKHPYR